MKCPYCQGRLPVIVRKATSYETEFTGQLKTTVIKECPQGCMHREAIRKGLIKVQEVGDKQNNGNYN